MVGGERIELSTLRFSAPCSTTELPTRILEEAVGFEPTVDLFKAHSRFQGERDKPDSAILPLFNLVENKRFELFASTVQV